MVAVSAEDLFKCKGALPRVMHKLLIPVNPRTAVSKTAAEISGLSNANLVDALPFEYKIYSLINNFLNVLKKPICLLAHNGNRFDYPILSKELKSINQTLSEDILTIDTLHMFQQYYKGCQNEIQELLNDGCDDVLLEALDAVDNDLEQCNIVDHNNVVQRNTADLNNLEEEVSKSVILSNCKPSTSQSDYATMMQRINEKTPESRIIKSKYSNSKYASNARRSLDFGKQRQSSFKCSLGNIHKHLFQADPIQAHTAEGDCLILMRCVSEISDFAQNWIKENAVPLIKHAK